MGDGGGGLGWCGITLGCSGSGGTVGARLESSRVIVLE